MGYPAGVTLRPVEFAPSGAIETGEPLRIEAVTRASRWLIWAATGEELFPDQRVLDGEVGAGGLVPLPCTDLSGWIDGETGDVVDPAVGTTHTYQTSVWVSRGHRQVARYEMGPYPVPSGVGSLPWSSLRNSGYAPPAVPSNGAQVFDLTGGEDFPPAAPDGAWGVDLTPVVKPDGTRVVRFYRKET